MHNATTKQRLSALRRKLGIFTGAPRWVRERRARLARFEAAAASLLGFDRAAEHREATPVPALASGMRMAAASLPEEAASSTRWTPARPSEPATQAASSTRWTPAHPSEPATQAASQERMLVTTSDLVVETDPSPRSPGPAAAPEATQGADATVAAAGLAADASAAPPHAVSTSMIEPATASPARPWTRETAREWTPDSAREFSRDAVRKVELDTTSDLAPVGKAAGWRRPERREGAASPRRGPSRRAVALAAAAVAAVVGIFLALRPRAPAPAGRGLEVEAPAIPAPAVAAPADVAPAPAAAAAVPDTAARPPAPAAGAVLIQRGDTLWALAAAHLGDPMLWPRLHAANRDRIRDPDLIYPGQEIELPER